MKLEQPQVVLVERRRRGRPRVGEAEAHFQLPGDIYDAAYRIASRQRVDINEIFRQAIRAHVVEELKAPTELIDGK